MTLFVNDKQWRPGDLVDLQHADSVKLTGHELDQMKADIQRKVVEAAIARTTKST
jgi:hypothetical protein